MSTTFSGKRVGNERHDAFGSMTLPDQLNETLILSLSLLLTILLRSL